ncbi:MAG: hypothetical protein LBC07_02720 [Elusimicrobiota bacterium]|nr:hypothetical protein [Elusimicrobiota bacterium]
MKKIFAALALIFAGHTLVFAQDVRVVDYTNELAQNLGGRTGLGVEYISYRGFDENSEIPALTVRYWIDDNVSVEAQLGWSSAKTRDVLFLGGKFLAIIKNFKTINIYASAFGGGGYANNKGSYGNEQSEVFKFGAGLGAEWFVVDRLSLSFEGGLEWMFNTNGNIGNSFGIFGDLVNRAGVRFYW